MVALSLEDYRSLMRVVGKIQRQQGMPEKYTGKMVLQLQDGVVRGVGFDCSAIIDAEIIRQFKGKDHRSGDERRGAEDVQK